MALLGRSRNKFLDLLFSLRSLHTRVPGQLVTTTPVCIRSSSKGRLPSTPIGRYCIAYLHMGAGLFSGGEYEWKDPKSPDEIVTISYIDRDGNKHTIQGKIGDNALYLAHRHGIEMEGACEASLACTTCHVYVDANYQQLLPEAHEEEEDLLDLAPLLQENSRLGCQIILTKELNGIILTLPKATRNFYVDGHTPQPH